MIARGMLRVSSLLLLLVFVLCVYAKTPVILDTDIGQDMDDSWALSLALLDDSLDIKMILTAAHNAEGRAQIVAKVLTTLGRTEIPIGVGLVQDTYVGPLYGWAQSFDLKTYKGTLYKDGVGAAISIINNSSEPVNIIAIAPMGNLQAMVQRDPNVTKKSVIVAMSGSIYKCYSNGAGACAEYNVAENVAASQQVYNLTDWKMIITPLDTCGVVVIEGTEYQQLVSANKTGKHPVLTLLLENFAYWRANGGTYGNPNSQSTTLYDAVAYYLTATNRAFCNMQDVKLLVNSKGVMEVTANGHPISAAVSWVANGVSDWVDFTVGRLIA